MKRPVGIIPKYLIATSPKGLRRLMLKEQIKLGYGLHFFDIQKDGKKWVAWFYDNESIGSHNYEAELGTTDKENGNT